MKHLIWVLFIAIGMLHADMFLCRAKGSDQEKYLQKELANDSRNSRNRR